MRCRRSSRPRTPKTSLTVKSWSAYLAKVACSRFLSCARCLTSTIRVRGRSRWSRNSPGGIQTVGSVPFRCSRLSPRTARRSVLLISLPSSASPCGRARAWGHSPPPRSRRRSNTSSRSSPPPPATLAHTVSENPEAPLARARSAPLIPLGRRAEPLTPVCNACGHRTRYIAPAAPPLAADATERLPMHTVTSSCAEAQRFHPINGKRP
jgi:hypothetical protein